MCPMPWQISLGFNCEIKQTFCKSQLCVNWKGDLESQPHPLCRNFQSGFLRVYLHEREKKFDKRDNTRFLEGKNLHRKTDFEQQTIVLYLKCSPPEKSERILIKKNFSVHACHPQGFQKSQHEKSFQRVGLFPGNLKNNNTFLILFSQDFCL